MNSQADATPIFFGEPLDKVKLMKSQFQQLV